MVLTVAVGITWSVGAKAITVYVSNEKDNSISVIDGDTYEVLETVPVGQRPRGIILSKDNSKLFVCTSDDDHIEVLDLSTFEVVGTLPSGPDPETFDISPDGRLLYVANEDDNMVTVIDVESAKMVTEVPVGVEPEGMGISPDGKVLINTSETTNMAHFIDTGTFEIFANVLVDNRPRIAEFNRDGSLVWVSSEIGGTVSIVDTETRQIVHKISFTIPGVQEEAIQPVGVRLTGDGKLAFVALGPANRVAVIDQQTYEVKKYLLVGQRVWQMAFTPDEKRLFTTNGVSNDVSVIDVEKLRVRIRARDGGRSSQSPLESSPPAARHPPPAKIRTGRASSGWCRRFPRGWSGRGRRSMRHPTGATIRPYRISQTGSQTGVFRPRIPRPSWKSLPVAWARKTTSS
jgi:PQQ-dependent catabolism-associated beta-propeller protein